MNLLSYSRVHSLAVSDIRSETKGSRFKSGFSVSVLDGSGREELKKVSHFSCCPVNRECSIKKTQVEKKLVNKLYDYKFSESRKLPGLEVSRKCLIVSDG